MHGRNTLLGNLSSSWLEKIEHPNLCWKICTDHSPGLERTKVVIPGNLFIREVLLEGGNSFFFSQQV